MKFAPLYSLAFIVIVGGLFISSNVSGATSIYDGEEIDQDQSKANPVSINIENLRDQFKQFLTFNIDDYFEKPEGSIFNVDFKTMKASINTGIFWEYIKIIPNAIFTMFFAKVIEFIEIIIQIFVTFIILITEFMNTIMITTYHTLGIEWEYERYHSEEQGIAYRTVEVHVAEGDSAVLAQMIHYVYGFTLSIIFILIIIKIIDQLIGIAGYDIPFI